MGIEVKLQTFEGPLDLLLHLLDKNKMNILDIPIVEITEQYMDYLHEMERNDLNIMSEFLVMAATLLEIKAKMLLPPEVNEEGEEEDPRQELVEKLLEYKMYRYMSYELKDRQLDAQRAFFKEPTLPEEVKNYEQPVDLDALLGDLTLAKLHTIFQSMLKKQENRIDPIRSKYGNIEREEVKLGEKMAYVRHYANAHRKFSFRKLLERQGSKMEVVVTFLVILELIKIGKVQVEQEHLFDDIQVTVLETMEEADFAALEDDMGEAEAKAAEEAATEEAVAEEETVAEEEAAIEAEAAVAEEEPVVEAEEDLEAEDIAAKAMAAAEEIVAEAMATVEEDDAAEEDEEAEEV